MTEVDDDVFESLVSDGIDAIPINFRKRMSNVAIVVEDEPSAEQKKKLRLCNGQLLFGLYEGIPQPKRGSGYNFVLPDKITIFKKPLTSRAKDLDDLAKMVKNTVWHEVAHHFGLDHRRIYDLEAH